MILNPICRQNQTLFSLLSFLISHRRISSSLPLSSNLKHAPKNPNPNPSNSKKQKPSCHPPSSLDRTATKPLHSDLPFDFRYSYTENGPLPLTRPIQLREPKYSPFGPGRIDRVWDGVCAPVLVDPAVKSVGGDPNLDDADSARKSREKILGEPLSDAERRVLVERSQRNKTKQQVNLGRDGLTHNMLNLIHNHWKHAEAIRIKCMGVPTVDMENVCTQLEHKTGGQIIYMQGGLIVLYRGRRYSPKKRPVIPLMLWKPSEPIYPRLIGILIDGLTTEQTKEMRKKGLAVPALTALAKNGFYGNLVPMVQGAFLTDELVRIDCKSLDKSDYRKIGCKLRVGHVYEKYEGLKGIDKQATLDISSSSDGGEGPPDEQLDLAQHQNLHDLVPCVLVTFEEQQIVIWRGKNCPSRAELISEDG